MVPFPLESRIQNAYVTKIIASLRTVSGDYLGGQGNADLSQYIQSGSIYPTAQGVVFNLYKESGWGVLNNTPIAGGIALNVTFD